MTTYTDIDSFFHGGVIRFPNDYYLAHNTECNICQDAEITNATEMTTNVLVPSTTIVKVETCSHIFHKVCLHEWLISARSSKHEATCPMCRAVLLTNPESETSLDSPDEQLRQSLQARVDRLNEQTPQSAAERYEHAQEFITIVAAMHSSLGLDVHADILVGLIAFMDAYEADVAVQPQSVDIDIWSRLRRRWNGISGRNRL